LFRLHPDESPVVELGAGSYMPKEKKRGRKYFATFNIVGWMKNADVEALHGSAATAAANEADGGADNPENYAQTATTTATVDTPKVEEKAPDTGAGGRKSRTF
jgi:hypothetical protein